MASASQAAALEAPAGESLIDVEGRPFLRDPDDDMVLGLALAAGCRYIITHNVQHFDRSEQLGVTALSPRDFLNLVRSRP
ncbi:MAG TPA: PIN domain-containing protein [Gemmataceae bacterium]|nr:PIN domain-containing protein [Gemmataceae bacterium]